MLNRAAKLDEIKGHVLMTWLPCMEHKVNGQDDVVLRYLYVFWLHSGYFPARPVVVISGAFGLLQVFPHCLLVHNVGAEVDPAFECFMDGT
jgi:hypothetical protein